MSIKVGIIGTGKHGTRYANHIVSDIERLNLTAISRRSEEAQAQADQWRCAWHPDWPDLVADEQVEAVIAVVPPALNLGIARACTTAGKPLLLEKPLAANLQAAREIVDLFDHNNLSLTVAQTLRYNSVIRTFRRHLPSIGRLYGFSAIQRLEPSTLLWHEQPELAGAGVSYHTAVHVFDALRFITGLEVTRVMALCRQRQNRQLEDQLTVLLEMENGVVGTVDCSKVGRARSGRFEFVGEAGQLCGDQVHHRCEQIEGMEITPLDSGKPVGTIVPLLEQWTDFLLKEAENPIPGREGLAAVRICEACLQSARTGKWISLE